jgi:hypothetical protein
MRVSTPLEIQPRILTLAEPIFFAGRAIAEPFCTAAFHALAKFNTRRVVTEVTDGFHLDLVSNAEAWVAQHVGKEADAPCINCGNGNGPFLGRACIVVDDHLIGSCAGCHYNSGGHRCSFRKMVGLVGGSVIAAAGVQDGKSFSVFDDGLLTGKVPATRARSRALTTPPRPSQTVSPVHPASPSPALRFSPPPVFSPAPVFSRDP